MLSRWTHLLNMVIIEFVATIKAVKIAVKRGVYCSREGVYCPLN
jgi:hypothetical protein